MSVSLCDQLSGLYVDIELIFLTTPCNVHVVLDDRRGIYFRYVFSVNAPRYFRAELVNVSLCITSEIILFPSKLSLS